MGATPFRHLDFAPHEPVTKEKLDQLQSNIQWVVDNSPVALHSTESSPATINDLIIVGGRLVLNNFTSWAGGSTGVMFNGAFDSATSPVITLGLGSEINKQVHCTLSGIGTALLPDSRGFEIYAWARDQASNTTRTLIIYWMATGKRSPNYDRF